MRKEFKMLIDALANGARPERGRIDQWLEGNVAEADREELEAIKSAYAAAYGTEWGADETTAFDGIVDGLGGWIGEYMDLTRISDSSTAYHFATALTMVSAAMKRRSYYRGPGFVIYPPIQALLLGPAGRTRKSTAASYGIENVLRPSGVAHILPDGGSPEGLVSALQETMAADGDATGILWVSELAVYLSRQEYKRGLVELLTDLFDSRDVKDTRTIKRGGESLRNVAMAALFCSNEHLFATSIPTTAQGSGFLSRILVFHQTDRRESGVPAEREVERLASLRERLISARFLHGRVTMSVSAEKLSRSFYQERYESKPADPEAMAFWERSPAHAIRIAMVLSASDRIAQGSEMDPGAIKIDLEHVERATAVVRWIESKLSRVFAMIGATEYGADHVRIYQYIEHHGGRVGADDLARHFSRRMSWHKVEEHLKTMTHGGVLRKERGVDPWDEKEMFWKIVRALY